MKTVMETNGPSNIIMHLDLCRRLGKKPNLDLIQQNAAATVAYMRAWQGGSGPAWSTIKKQYPIKEALF